MYKNQLLALVCYVLVQLSPVLNAMESGDCRALLSQKDKTNSIISSEYIHQTDKLPAHCRVHGMVPPAVQFELRLPEKWNGKFFMVGNGGYLGVFFDQSYGLSRGYATASTDTGHQGPDPKFALNNRTAEIDFAYRAIHVTTLAAKQLVEKFYGRLPEYSYYRGCSTGGRQGLMEVQRFPEDFDGWSIGAPIYDYTYKQIYNAAWVTQALFANDRKGYIPRSKLKALGKAVYQQCDVIDGIEDGIIDDPRKCDFEPHKHLKQCKGNENSNDCFSAAQLEAITKIYDGPGSDIYPGHVKGGEWLDVESSKLGGGWDVYFTGILKPDKGAKNTIGQMDRDPYGGGEFKAVQLRNAISFFKYLAFEKDQPDYDVLKDLDFRKVPDVSFMSAMMNAAYPDLKHIYASNKKILLWHGWADVGLNPIRTIQYYDAVKKTVEKDKIKEFMRLFMVPGMYHCEGGPGPDIFDDLSALEQWVENGKAPRRMIAYKTEAANSFYPDRSPGKLTDKLSILRSRPLCVYPEVARYKGEGSIDQASSFECVAP
jgi:Tannase and feruloyl esterase